MEVLSKLFTNIDTSPPGVDVANMSVSAVLCTETVDRQGDSINPAGINLAMHRANPVVMFCHKLTEMPIAKAVDKDGAYTVRLDASGRLVGTAFFSQGNELAEETFKLYADGTCRGWSVTVLPKSSRIMQAVVNGKRGSRVDKSELLEYSAAAIPVNPETLTARLSKGFSAKIEPIMREVFKAWVIPPKEFANGWTAPLDNAREIRMATERVLQTVLLPVAGFDAEKCSEWLKAKSIATEKAATKVQSSIAGGESWSFEILPPDAIDGDDAGEARDMGDGCKGLYFTKAVVDPPEPITEPTPEPEPVETTVVVSKAYEYHDPKVPHGAHAMSKLLNLLAEHHQTIEQPKVKAMFCAFGQQATALAKKVYPDLAKSKDMDFGSASSDDPQSPMSKGETEPLSKAETELADKLLGKAVVPTTPVIDPAAFNAMTASVAALRDQHFRLTGQRL